MLGRFTSKVWKTAACGKHRPAYNAVLMPISPALRKTLRIIVIGQCAGLIASLLFGNGFMLAYFSQMGIPDYRILFLFSLPPLIGMLLTVPFAAAADRVGKKQLGGAGLLISTAGFMMLVAAPVIAEEMRHLWLLSGTLVFAAGNAANASSWFALLSPIVPEEIRGRWFGQMRTAWQTTAILFSLGVSGLLKLNSSLMVFQLVALTAGLLILVRFALYLKIPEMEPSGRTGRNPWQTLKWVVRIPGYLPFCAYMFLLSFLTGAVPGLLGLLEKEFLGFSDSSLVVMGNLLSIGTVAGFLAGGRIVDRFGSRPVFMAGHAVFSLTLIAVLLRGQFPLPATVVLGTLTFVFGAAQGAAGIAGTSELLALIPQENKSFSTALNLAMIAAGVALSGLCSGQILKLNILQSSWTLLGHAMSTYDALLAGFTGLIAILATTTGLVPAIRHLHSQWLPQNK